MSICQVIQNELGIVYSTAKDACVEITKNPAQNLVATGLFAITAFGTSLLLSKASWSHHLVTAGGIGLLNTFSAEFAYKYSSRVFGTEEKKVMLAIMTLSSTLLLLLSSCTGYPKFASLPIRIAQVVSGLPIIIALSN